MAAWCKCFHWKLSLMSTRRSLASVFNFRMKAGAKCLHGPLTKWGDGHYCFLSYIREKVNFWAAVRAGRDSWDPLNELVNVWLGVTGEQWDQRSKVGSWDIKGGSQGCFSNAAKSDTGLTLNLVLTVFEFPVLLLSECHRLKWSDGVFLLPLKRLLLLLYIPYLFEVLYVWTLLKTIWCISRDLSK